MRAVAGILTGRRTAWAALLGCVIALGGALALVPQPGQVSAAGPASAGDSLRVAQWQAEVPSADTQDALVVWTRADGAPFSRAQQAAIGERVTALAAESVHPTSVWAQPSVNREVIIASVQVPTRSVRTDATAAAGSIERTADAGLPSGVTVRLAGEVAAAAARPSSAGIAALVALIVLAAVLLVLATRSALLWLVALVLTDAAAVVGQSGAVAIGSAIGLPVSPGGVLLVLAVAFGLGTAYSALVAVRLRTELKSEQDHVTAAYCAVRATVPGILATSAIVVVGSLVLLFAADMTLRALGLAFAFTTVLVTVAVLIAVPAGLALFGRRAFWPFSPRADSAVRRASRHVVLVTFATAVTLSLLAVGVSAIFAGAGSAVAGEQATLARASIDSAFTRGYGNQATMLVPNSLRGETSTIAPTTLAMALPNVHAVTVGASHDGYTQLVVDLDADPGSARALEDIRTLRHRLAVTGGPTALTLVGGQDAAEVDRADAAVTDLAIVVPIAVVVALVLLLLGTVVERRRRASVVAGADHLK